MRFGSGRFFLAILLAAAGVLAGSCSLPPGVIELTVSSDATYGGGGWTGTLRILIRESKSGDLVASSSVSGYPLDFSDPYEYSYGGAGEGRYVVIAYLDVDDDGTFNAGDVGPTALFPNVDVTSEETTEVSITLDKTM
jgi:hypothetical protein